MTIILSLILIILMAVPAWALDKKIGATNCFKVGIFDTEGNGVAGLDTVTPFDQIDIKIQCGANSLVSVNETGDTIVDESGGYYYICTNDAITSTTEDECLVWTVGQSPLSTPVNITFTQGAGTLSTATYYYRISATDSLGKETLASAETSLAITGPAGVNVNWSAVGGASGYKIYGRSTGAELYMATVGAVTTWLDGGSITPSGALPTLNATGEMENLISKSPVKFKAVGATMDMTGILKQITVSAGTTASAIISTGSFTETSNKGYVGGIINCPAATATENRPVFLKIISFDPATDKVTLNGSFPTVLTTGDVCNVYIDTVR